MDVAAYVAELQAVPMTRITCAWYTSLFLSCIITLCGLVAVGAEGGSANGNRGAGFGAIWSIFMLIAMGLGGTFVLRKARRVALARLTPAATPSDIHSSTRARSAARRWRSACCSARRL